MSDQSEIDPLIQSWLNHGDLLVQVKVENKDQVLSLLRMLYKKNLDGSDKPDETLFEITSVSHQTIQVPKEEWDRLNAIVNSIDVAALCKAVDYHP